MDCSLCKMYLQDCVCPPKMDWANAIDPDLFRTREEEPVYNFNPVGDEINQEAKHFDDNKPELQYILSMRGLYDVARVGTYGAKKYGQYNYKAGMPWMKLLGSCSRHLVSFILGEDLDYESALPHLAHLIYDALMVMDYAYYHKELDDRYKQK